MIAALILLGAARIDPTAGAAQARRDAAPAIGPVRTLLSVAGVDAFAQDGPRIAWADSGQPCRRSVRLHDLRTGRTVSLVTRDGASCTDARYSEDRSGFGGGMAIAGERALFATVIGSNNSDHFLIYAGSPRRRDRRVGRAHVAGGVTGWSSVSLMLAGDGETLVFAFPTSSEDRGDGYYLGAAFTVGGDSRPRVVRRSKRPTALAASGSRFALARDDRDRCFAGGETAWQWNGGEIGDGRAPRRARREAAPCLLYPVEIRATATHAVVSRFEAPAPVTGLALTRSAIALLVRRDRSAAIELRRPTGARIATYPVRRDAYSIGMNERWLVYRVAYRDGSSSVRAIDRRTARDTVLARVPGHVVGLSLKGDRAAWGEQLAGRDRIRAVTLPAAR